MPFDGRMRAFVSPPGPHRERLLQLCRVIEGISDDVFDLRDWARNGRCDSVACAVGWAIRDDWFRAAGLGRDDRTPVYGGERSWRAVRGFFGLTREQAFDLFHAGRYESPTRQAVLARIRALAEG